MKNYFRIISRKFNKKEQFMSLLNQVTEELKNVKTHQEFLFSAKRFIRLYKFFNKHYRYFYKLNWKVDYISQCVFDDAGKRASINTINEYIEGAFSIIRNTKYIELRYDAYKKLFVEREVGFYYEEGVKYADILTPQQIIKVNMLLMGIER